MKSRTFLARSEKRLFALCGVLIAIILGGGWYWSSLEAEPTWNIPAPPETPQPNGFDLYLAAAQAITPANPPVDTADDPTRVTDPKIYAQKYSLAKKRAWLKQNEAGFTLFQQAIKTPTIYPQGAEAGSLPHSPLRHLARSKMIEVNARKMAGDWDGAMESGLDTVQMGHDIRRGGALIGSLVGNGIGSVGRGYLYDVPEKMSANAAKISARRLEGLFNRRMSASGVMESERDTMLRQLRDAMKESNWRGFNQEWTWQQKLQVRLTSKRRAISEYEHAMKIIIANSALPYATPATPLPEVNVVTEQWISSDINRFRFSDTRDQAGDIILMLRLALQAYRLEHGQYPAKLEELTPEYLKAIPNDPFSDAPLHYKKTGQTYLLWSIGPDGKNDGGKPIPHKKPPRVIPGIPVAPPAILHNSKGDYVAGKNR